MNIEQILTSQGISAVSILIILIPIIKILFNKLEDSSRKREDYLLSEINRYNEKNEELVEELKKINNLFIEHLQTTENEHLKILSENQSLIRQSNEIHEKHTTLLDKLIILLNFHEHAKQ